MCLFYNLHILYFHFVVITKFINFIFSLRTKTIFTFTISKEIKERGLHSRILREGLYQRDVE